MDVTLSLAEIIDAAAILVAAGAIYFGLSGVKTQIQATVYNEFTHRFSDIAEHFPKAIFMSAKQLETEPQSFDQADLELALRKYFELLSMEHHMQERGFIHRETWRMWRESTIIAFMNDIVRSAWLGGYQSYFDYNPRFRDFIAKTVIPEAERRLKKAR